MFGFGKKPQQIYCSIDIEATGFDPLKEEILEIGFAFFTLSDKGGHITEEWSQVFRPSKQVAHKILGLTGITEEEINVAPKLFELREFVQKKIGSAILLGHSVGVDVKYLETNGFTLSGRYIDTLELVQFILPTHHSYNLENLMHYFGIAHPEAHRALADARATIGLLEKLLGVYWNFPETLRNQIVRLAAPFSPEWLPMLLVSIPAFSAPAPTQAGKNAQVFGSAVSKYKPDHAYLFPVGTDIENLAVNTLAQEKGKTLLVISRTQNVLQVWKQTGVPAVFMPEDLFDENKYNSLLTQPAANFDLAKFLIKVLVWKTTNWQTITILDLNVSFFGNQFRSLVTGKKLFKLPDERILLCDQSAFLRFADMGLCADRKVVLEGIQAFEQRLRATVGKRASWGHAIRLLQSIYNPETNIGYFNLKTEIVNALAATDLFFGLTILISKSLQNTGPFLNRELLESDTRLFRRLETAARNYVTKLKHIHEASFAEPILKFAENLLQFFEPATDNINWIEFGEHHCVFNSFPLHIEERSKNVRNSCRAFTLLDTVSPKLSEYFLTRIGLHKVFTAVPSSAKTFEAHVRVKVLETNLSNTGTEALLASVSLPAVIIFPDSLRVKEFYDFAYKRLQEIASIFAEGYSGGTNKMLNNFQTITNGLLLLSAKLVSRTTKQRIPIKTLIIDLVIPSGRLLDPYAQALKAEMAYCFPDIDALDQVAQIENTLKVFYSENLKNIYVFNKNKELIHTPEWQALWSFLPWAELPTPNRGG